MSFTKLRPGRSCHRVDTEDPTAMPVNSWTNISADTFSVRVGPGYSRYKRKDMSSPVLYDCVAVDVYSTANKISHISRIIDLDTLDDPNEQVEHDSYLPQTIVVSCQIPGYTVEHALWGRNPENGPGFSLVFYYRQTADTRATLKKRRERIARGDPAEPHPIDTSDESAEDFKHLYTEEAMSQWANVDDQDLSPALRLLHRFVTANAAAGTDANARHFILDRLKGIARIMNLEDANIATAPKKLIQTYNSTPFLIRTTSTFFNDPSGQNKYFEVDVDLHRFGYLARVGLMGVRERIRDVVFDWAFVIEGHTDEELPENILSAARLSKLDVTDATPLPAEYAAILANDS